MSDPTMTEALALLKARYLNLIKELEAIKGQAALNQPEVKAQDGGTTILKTAKIKQLEESIAATARMIKEHQDVLDELSGANDPWTIESQMEL